MWDILHSGRLFVGFTEDLFAGSNVIRRDQIDEMCDWMIKAGKVISFTEYKDLVSSNIRYFKFLCEFLEGINPEEETRRWDRVFALHLNLMAFLNTYGYDFQHYEEDQIRKWIERQKKYDIFPNLIEYIGRHKLEKQKEVKKLIKILRAYNSGAPFEKPVVVSEGN